MTSKQVSRWLEEKGLRPEDGASIFKIAFSTLQNGLRGARWSDWTIEKIKRGMAEYESTQATKAG